MSHIRNIRVTDNTPEERVRDYFQEALESLTPDFKMVLVGPAPCWRVEYQVFVDGVVALLQDEFGCIVAMGEVVL